MKVYGRTLFSMDDSDKIYDCFGNTCKLEEIAGLTAVFESTNSSTAIPQNLDYENFSVILNEKTGSTFASISGALLSNMQKIEILLYQLLLRRRLTVQDYITLETYFGLENLRIDGKVSTDEYAQLIKRISADMLDPILKMMNVRAMHNFIYDELFHAQYRMIDGFNSQFQGIKSVASELNIGREIRSFSIYADNTAFCYQDALKAIFKVLDILSKWLSYISCYKDLKKGVPQVHFSDMPKKLNKFEDGPFKQRLENVCDALKILIQIRNEITHNESLSQNRQLLFIGHGTGEVDGKELFYSKMLFWDHDEHILKRTNGTLGFFTQNLDALVETRSYFVKAMELVALCLEHFFYLILDELVVVGIKQLVIQYGVPETSFTIEEVRGLYRHIN